MNSGAALSTSNSGALSSDLERALDALKWLKNNGTPWAPASLISQTLRDVFCVSLHWKTIQTELLQNADLTARRWRSKTREFSLMGAGIERLPGGGQIMVVDPAKALRAVSTLHDFIRSMTGTIKICDPYLDRVSLEHLDAAPAGARILYLTSKKMNSDGEVRRLAAALSGSNNRFEIRVTNTGLHDRYLIDDKSMTILGASLNGFGKTQCFVVRAGHDIRQTMVTAFDAAWRASSSPWPQQP